MDRDTFLRTMRSNAVQLHPVTLPGWVAPVYLKPLTLGDIKRRLGEAAPAEGAKSDPLHMARSIADLVHDQHGVLLFDRTDDAQMTALSEAMENASLEIMKILQAEFGKLNDKPTAEEVDPSGN